MSWPSSSLRQQIITINHLCSLHYLIVLVEDVSWCKNIDFYLKLCDYSCSYFLLNKFMFLFQVQTLMRWIKNHKIKMNSSFYVFPNILHTDKLMKCTR